MMVRQKFLLLLYALCWKIEKWFLKIWMDQALWRQRPLHLTGQVWSKNWKNAEFLSKLYKSRTIYSRLNYLFNSIFLHDFQKVFSKELFRMVLTTTSISLFELAVEAAVNIPFTEIDEFFLNRGQLVPGKKFYIKIFSFKNIRKRKLYSKNCSI